MPPGRIYVSRDNYVLDGHHRWAAVVALDLEDNTEGDLDMNVEMVDMDILQLLAETVKWTVEMGVEPKGGGKGSGGESVTAQAEKKDLGDSGAFEEGTGGLQDGEGREGGEDIGEFGPEALIAADIVDADPDHLGDLSDEEWGQLLDVLHGDDLAGVKSVNDAVMRQSDADGLPTGDVRARHLLLWADRNDEKVDLSDTALELVVLGLESKAKGHSLRVHPGLDRSPKENWVDKAGGLPSYIERIAKHLHHDRGMTISRAIATAVNRVKKWASGVGDVKPDTRAKGRRRSPSGRR